MSHNSRTFTPRQLMREGFAELFSSAAEEEGAFIFIRSEGIGSAAAQKRYPQFAGKKFLVTLVEDESCEQPSA